MSGETVMTVVGNLTADPELRYTQNGLAVVSFTIASTPSTYDRQQNKFVEGDPLFLRCSAWKEFAEHIAGSLAKGMSVIAQGRLKQTSWETKEGEKRTGFELQVDAIGPNLRWSTAEVTRANQGNRNQERHHQKAAPARESADGFVPDESPADAAWASSYNDETPF